MVILLTHGWSKRKKEYGTVRSNAKKGDGRRHRYVQKDDCLHGRPVASSRDGSPDDPPPPPHSRPYPQTTSHTRSSTQSRMSAKVMFSGGRPVVSSAAAAPARPSSHIVVRSKHPLKPSGRGDIRNSIPRSRPARSRPWSQQPPWLSCCLVCGSSPSSLPFPPPATSSTASCFLSLLRTRPCSQKQRTTRPSIDLVRSGILGSFSNSSCGLVRNDIPKGGSRGYFCGDMIPQPSCGFVCGGGLRSLVPLWPRPR